MGEKGNLAVDDPLLALDALPLDVLQGSPETVSAWLDTYTKYREARAAGAPEEVDTAATEAGTRAGDTGPSAGG